MADYTMLFPIPSPREQQGEYAILYDLWSKNRLRRLVMNHQIRLKYLQVQGFYIPRPSFLDVPQWDPCGASHTDLIWSFQRAEEGAQGNVHCLMHSSHAGPQISMALEKEGGR